MFLLVTGASRRWDVTASLAFGSRQQLPIAPSVFHEHKARERDPARQSTRAVGMPSCE